MDQPDPVIKRVRALTLPLLEIESQDGHRYTVDLERSRSVHCFPQSPSEWSQVSSEGGDRIVWASGFEVHIDQALVSLIKKEKLA